MSALDPRTPEDAKRVGDEARLLYTTAVAEIAGFKQQQWHVANYGVLAYAAIVSVSRLLIPPIHMYEKALLGLIAVGVCAIGWSLIRMFHNSIQVRRERLTYLRSTQMSEEFLLAWRAGRSAEEMPDLPEEKTKLEPLFRGVFLLGLAATLWLLWR